MFGLFSKIKSITSAELAQSLQQRKSVGEIIDVREPHEYARGHIKGARNIPLGQISSYELPRGKKYFLICQSGMRSKKAYKILYKRNYNVTNVQGGLLAWKSQLTRKG